VEERLKFYDTGDAPRKNVDVMSAVAESLRKIAAKNDKGDKKDKKKKRDREVEATEEEVVVDDGEKKKKKKKVCFLFFTGIQ
jgi:nucleolar protein 56